MRIARCCFFFFIAYVIYPLNCQYPINRRISAGFKASRISVTELKLLEAGGYQLDLSGCKQSSKFQVDWLRKTHVSFNLRLKEILCEVLVDSERSGGRERDDFRNSFSIDL